MRFKDPWQVQCPECGLVSEHAFKDLLALQAKCPHCGHGQADIGKKMQQTLDDVLAHHVMLALQVAIEDDNSALRFEDPEIDPPDGYRSLCLRDLAAMTEALLDYLPAAERHNAALRLLEAAFHKEFPGKPFPPLQTRFMDLASDWLEPLRRRSDAPAGSNSCLESPCDAIAPLAVKE